MSRVREGELTRRILMAGAVGLALGMLLKASGLIDDPGAQAVTPESLCREYGGVKRTVARGRDNGVWVTCVGDRSGQAWPE